jgi:hypothetical protein
MPERWEREVGKLGTVAAPPSIATRIAEGARGDGVPPAPHRGQRLVALVVAFAVFGAAAVFAAGAFRSSGSTLAAGDPTKTVVIHLDSSGGPSAALEYDGQTAHPQIGSNCWSEGGTSRCADTVLVPFVADDFVKVPSGTPLALEGDGALTSAVATLDLTDDPRDAYLRTEPLQPVDSIGDGTRRSAGRYVLAVRAEWPQGSVSFYFPVEIVPPGSTPASAPELRATLGAPADGTAPSLVLSYGGHERSFSMQGGSWPGVDGFPAMLQVFDTPIPAGTVLRVEGDANRVMAEIEADGGSNPSDLDLTAGSATLPSEPGLYQLTIKGAWDLGDAVFPVQIRIVDATGDASPTTEPVPTSPEATSPNEASNQPSASPTSVTVPDVVGLTVNDALQLLHDAGLDAVGTWTPGSESSVGQDVVVSQDPPAGVEVAASTPVRLDAGAP